jgi:transposase
MAWRRGQAYGQDLRDRVLACPDMTLVQVAARFGVSPSYVSKVRARLRNLGDPAPGQQRCHVPLRLADLTEELKTQIRRFPDATLNELRLWLSQTYRVSVSYSVMWKVVARLGLTYKKSTYRPRNSAARTSPRPASNGRRGNLLSIPSVLSSSTRPGPRPT